MDMLALDRALVPAACPGRQQGVLTRARSTRWLLNTMIAPACLFILLLEDVRAA